MTLTVLQVAYPLAAAGPDSAGGAEQILVLLDRALVTGGHRSLVLAAEGSRVSGELIGLPRERGPLDGRARARAQRRCGEALRRVLDRRRVDVVHLHGVDFARYLPPPGPAALVTLHLPIEWYEPAALSPRRPRTHFVCVSSAQRRECPPAAPIAGTIANGVDLSRLWPWPRPPRRPAAAVALGRICPEKGFDLALEAARLAGAPLLLGGQVHRYPEHEEHFRAEILPRLDRHRRFIGAVGGERKRRLLASARCVLVSSRVGETSCLVAMEALACGTPVVAFRAGALPELIEDGRTGFLVDDVTGMAEAITEADRLDRRACRAAAVRRCAAPATASAYLALYRRLAGGEAGSS